MQVSGSMTGTGRLTARQLIDMLNEFPPEAVVRVNAGTDPREREPYWSINAVWEQQNQPAAEAKTPPKKEGRIGDSIHMSRVPSPMTYGQFEHPAQFGRD